MYKITDITVGMNLPELKKPVNQEHINLYAEASGDFNPIHLDPEFGKKMQLGGTIAHGMMILAYISEFMAMNFGPSWLTGGKLVVRFKVPARPGDTVYISGKIVNISQDNNQIQVDCSITCQNQDGDVVINGDTKVGMTA